MIDIGNFAVMILSAATPLLFAALGETIVERAGVLNLGVEGMMITGAFTGFAVAHATNSPAAGFLAAALAGAALSMIFGLLSQFFLTNQVATGLALTLFGLGLTALLGKAYVGLKAPSMVQGPLKVNWIIWLGLALVIVLWWFLKYTRTGLILRGIGENHYTAHALGYKVRTVRMASIAFGGAMAGIGGAYISVAIVLQWTEGMTAGAGWIALAMVVFAGWHPLGVFIGACLFGGVTVLQLRLQAAGFAVPIQLLSMAPYIATIAALVLISARRRGSAAPGSLGQIFHATN